MLRMPSDETVKSKCIKRIKSKDQGAGVRSPRVNLERMEKGILKKC